MMTVREGQTEPIEQAEMASDPAARALRQAQIAATTAAIVPTILAAQGMVTLGRDVLELPLLVAIAIAVFLEIGLVASALLARASAVAGRPAGADAVAVWVLSLVSGILSSAHELLSDPDPLGHRSWEHDAPSLLAGAVRLVAPLVAAWLWERVLVSTRRQLAARSLTEIRRDRRLLRLGAAALLVQRLDRDSEGTGRFQRGRALRARRRLDRRHVALLRHTAPTDPELHRDIQTWLTGFGVVDHYPSMTAHHPSQHTAPLDVESAPVALTAAVHCDPVAVPHQEREPEQPDTDPEREVETASVVHDVPTQPTEPTVPTQPTQPTRPTQPTQPTRPTQPTEEPPPTTAATNSVPSRKLTARQMAAVEIVRASWPGNLSAPALARELRERGFATSDRTALRDLAMAKAHLGPIPLTVVR